MALGVMSNVEHMTLDDSIKMACEQLENIGKKHHTNNAATHIYHSVPTAPTYRDGSPPGYNNNR